MTYKPLVTVASLAGAVLLAVTLVLLNPPRVEAAPGESEPPAQPGVQSSAGNVPAEYEYLLREYEGRLAVFKPEEPAPDLVFDVFVHTLPQYDQEQLREGVPVRDYAELNARIEDYIS